MKRRCATLPFHIVRSVVKRNGIVLNDFGNVFLTRTVLFLCTYIGIEHWIESDIEVNDFRYD